MKIKHFKSFVISVPGGQIEYRVRHAPDYASYIVVVVISLFGDERTTSFFAKDISELPIDIE